MTSARDQDAAAKVAALDELTMAAALLYFRMRRAAEELMGEGAHSSGRRSILKGLARGGPQTVPQMARARGVSRQHVQQLVDSLSEDGLVERRENPAHKRSWLITITEEGRELARQTAKREARLLPVLAEEIPLTDLETTTRVLGHLKSAFESEEWANAVERVREE